MIMKEKPEKNDTGADGHGLGHATGIGDQGHVTSAPGRVTESAAIEDEIEHGQAVDVAFGFLC